MKKYIIPATEVLQLQTAPLLTKASMELNSNDSDDVIQNSENILTRRRSLWDEDEE